MIAAYNNRGLQKLELEIGRLAFSFSYRDNDHRLGKGFWSRFGV